MNLIEFLQEYDLEYWESGENVSPGWINIQCPFPECDDDKNHLGIKIKDLRVNCWKCGGHSIINLIRQIAECSFQEAKEILKSLGADDTYQPPINVDNTSSAFSEMVSLPRESSTNFPSMHIEYLRNRGFKTRNLIRKYKLQAVHNIGKYKFRIIIPIYMNKKLVCFTSRDITGQQEPPYRHGGPGEVIISAKKVIYNYDSVKSGGDAFLVEGPIDAWKLGDGAMSILGAKHSEQQVKLIMRKKINRLFIFFDSDKTGKKDSKKLGKIMAPLVRKVEILTLKDKNDPGQLTFAEADSIKAGLDFKA